MCVVSIDSLISDFIKEAVNAPRLFEDLSNMERYISETYKKRSIIELIQNADDANATCFGIHKTKFGFAICNDGREFSGQDLVALCRSGASNKQRGKDSIGYRGIGFKSVAQIAPTIALLSGKYTICFNKELTKNLTNVDSQIPLIRIPHRFTDESIIYEINKLKSQYNYTTIFAFINPSEEVILKEIESFDSTILLFLNNISTVIVDYNQHSKVYNKSFRFNSNNHIVKISDNKDCDLEWIVFKTKKGNSIAFKYQGGRIVEATAKEAVFHSFMPTLEFTGGFFKVNGDFTTDPSRKNIDLDSLSKSVLDDVAEFLADLFFETTIDKVQSLGLYTPFVSVASEFQSEIGNYFITLLVSKLRKKKWGSFTFDKIRRQPKWLNYNDFDVLCQDNFYAFSQEFMELYPNSNYFFERIGIKMLSVSDVINIVAVKKMSTEGYAQFIAKLISTCYCDSSSVVVDRIKKINIFPTKDGVCNAMTLGGLKNIDPLFWDILLNNVAKEELISFFNKLGFKAVTQFVSLLSVDDKNKISDINLSSNRLFKWRSAEQNLAEYIRQGENVKDVKDVSLANIGYDLEVVFGNNKRVFIEVKSVNFLGESIKITNNEYTCAHQLQELYYLALVVNSNDFKVVFIKNPIVSLEFSKQCERWSWVCQNYNENQLDLNSFVNLNL